MLQDEYDAIDAKIYDLKAKRSDFEEKLKYASNEDDEIEYKFQIMKINEELTPLEEKHKILSEKISKEREIKEQQEKEKLRKEKLYKKLYVTLDDKTLNEIKSDLNIYQSSKDGIIKELINRFATEQKILKFINLLRKKLEAKSKIGNEIMNQGEYEILLDEIERIKGLRQDYENKIKCTENVLEIHEYQNQMNVLKIELKRLLDLKRKYSGKYCSREEKIKREEEKIARDKEKKEREEKLTQTIREILFEDSTLLFALRKVHKVCLRCSKNMAIIELINQRNFNQRNFNLNRLSAEIIFFKNLSERSQKQLIRMIKQGEMTDFFIVEDDYSEDINIIKLFSKDVQQSIEKFINEYGFEFSWYEDNVFRFTKKLPDEKSFYENNTYYDYDYYDFCDDECSRLNDLLDNDKEISGCFGSEVEVDDDEFQASFSLQFGDLSYI